MNDSNCMKTRLFSLWLLLSVAVGLFAYDFEVDGLHYNIICSTAPYSSAEVANADKNLTIVNIPEIVTYKGVVYSVMWIGERAFSGCTGLTSITIPNSVTGIGNFAFSGCIGLISVTIGNRVTSIGSSAFYGCTGLTAITIPNSVTSIGESAFSNCASLTSVTIPNSVTRIGERAFSGCTGLTSITIPNSVTSIGNSAFSGVPNIVYYGTATGSPWNASSMNGYVDGYLVYEDETKTKLLVCSTAATGEIVIPNSVTSIGYGAFSGCTGLTSITIPNSVTSIGERAFSGCTGLTSITIPNSVTSIGNSAFSGVPNIVYYGTATGSPWNASSMNGYVDGYLVYEDETKTKLLVCSTAATGEIVIPNSVTSIGYGAFSGCTGLTSIIVPNSVTSIRDGTFSGCTGLTSITIPNSVTSIGDATFSGCTGLTSITIPESVTSIEAWTFSGCTGLTSITIPNSVTSIESSAFSGCTGLTSITIPNSVTSIGESAFRGCTGLTSITIPSKVTSIGNWAFADCTGLTSVAIPNSVTSIGNCVFSGCTNLTSVTIGNSVTSIGWSAFDYSQMHKFVCMSPDVEFSGAMPRFSYALDTIIAPARLLDVEESEWLTQPKYLKHAELTNGAMTDNVCRVLNRSYKTLLTLDLKGVSNTTIADEAFKGCYNLKTLRLPAQLTKVPYMAVADCKSLQEITIPATVEEIDNSAFENCRSIRSITFEGAVAPQGAAQYAPTTGCALWRIGNWAFYNCHELQNLLIPEGVTEIGDAAFYGCVYLQDMVLPGTVETIGDNAFALCSKLQKITVLSTTPPTIEAKTFYDVNRAIPVYVPAEAVADYKNDRYWKEFNIQSNATAIEQTSASNITPRKVFRDGQVYILRGGKTYTLTGVEVNL